MRHLQPAAGACLHKYTRSHPGLTRVHHTSLRLCTCRCVRVNRCAHTWRYVGVGACRTCQHLHTLVWRTKGRTRCELRDTTCVQRDRKMTFVASPFAHSWREVLAGQKQSGGAGQPCHVERLLECWRAPLDVVGAAARCTHGTQHPWGARRRGCGGLFPQALAPV